MLSPYVRSCTHKLCEFGGLNRAFCESLQAFGAACQAQGIKPPVWRNSSFCRECPLQPPSGHSQAFFHLCTSESSPRLLVGSPQPSSDFIFPDVDHLQEALSLCPLRPGLRGLLLSGSCPCHSPAHSYLQVRVPLRDPPSCRRHSLPPSPPSLHHLRQMTPFPTQALLSHSPPSLSVHCSLHPESSFHSPPGRLQDILL